jgi:hypothetical protein
MSRHFETLVEFLPGCSGWREFACTSGQVVANGKECSHLHRLCLGRGPSEIVKLLISGREDGGAHRVRLGWEVSYLDKVGYGGALG